MKLQALLFLALFPLTASAAAEWHPAPVVSIEVLESFPVQYAVTYERLCDDVAVAPVRIQAGEDLIIGVLVKNDPELDCGPTDVISRQEKLVIQGEACDPAQVKTLY